MDGKWPPSRPERLRAAGGVIPVGLLLAVGLLALLLGMAASEWIGVALVVFALCLTVLIIAWARARSGDLLVTAVALLLFWTPFLFTQTRLNVSPQELGVYGICIVCALFDRRGVVRWVGDLLSATTPLMRLATLVFFLACVQSFLRVSQPDLIAIVNSFHTIVLYPVVFGLLVAYTMRSRSAEQTLLKAFVAGATAFATYALILKVWGVGVENGAVAGRLGSESSFLAQYHPNNLSLYLVLALAFAPGVIGSALQNVQNLQNRREKGIASGSIWKVLGVLAATVVILIALWLTYSRGALGALALGIVVALGALAIRGRGIPRRLAIGVLGAGVGGIGALVLWKGPDIFGRYASLFNPLALSSDPDVTFRTNLYARALQVASAHPITGIGLQQFATTGSVPFSPHNTYLDLLVGAGIFATLAFAIVLLLGLGAAFASVRRASRSQQTIAMLYSLGFIVALVAFAVQAFVETYDINPRIAPIAWMLAMGADSALMTMMRQQRRKAEPATPIAPDTSDDSGQDPQRASAQGEGPDRDRDGDGHRVRFARLGRGVPRNNGNGWNGWDDGSGMEDNPANAVWRQETMMLPAWQFQAGDVDQWKVDSAQLPAIGRISRTDRRAGASATRARSPGQAAERAERAERAAEQQPGGTQAGEEMLQRAPTSFVWNQIYAMWFFATGFLLSIVITRGLSRDDYGIYAILTTIITTVTFLCAIGLEDAATVFLPRVQARDGSAATGALIRRMLVTRILIVGFVGLGLTAGLLVAAPIFVRLGIPSIFFEGSKGGLVGLRTIVIGLYLVGGSISTLQIAFFSALLRSRIVLLIGGISQVASVSGVFLLLRAGWGIDGVFAALAVVSWLTVLAYLVPLSGVIFARGKIRSVQRGEMRKLMVSAWLTNISNTALGKQMDIMIMTAFVVGSAAIGYYNLAYQLGSIIGVVLISGLGGVGMAAMSAALATGGARRLISMWRANIMLQVMLAIPLQALCFVFADQIVTVLYGAEYAGAALLLRVFLAFSMVGRLTGGGASQSALYVIGKQRSVVMLRWTGLVINVILDIILIQYFGPLGAMVGTGFSQVWVALMEYFLLRMHLGTAYPVAFTTRVTSVAAFASLLLLWWAPGGLFGLVAEFSLFWALFALGMWITNADDSNDLTDLMLANPKIKSIVGRISRLIPRRNPVSVAA